ncbi:RagB/SusD family nutrient uptake outer membrane protein [Flavobacterium lindanitolerans]|jgi:hypothetical protein|uniref:RagB/SusD family nutrient uptake outer membrane protein n=1 Tax=Flavobacterium lindanitolerans TaxID=428988 RepID=UPI000DB3E5AE|nr:RagB/SusD family nutrient uptake outer membrane protein [Flavobacterium lindanitolerans]PZO27844.1 MAG: RagB/SusD family nutrient uptake outer membrane protein [Flavobacteriaceae bacterium]THD34161.1 MAG: RagB/SusD family nutrient uptake outer membrane protein [Flavobacterium johnsoniae]
MNIKYFKSKIYILAFILLSACDSFTEVDLPEQQLTGNVTFQEASTAYAALSDIYSRIRDTGMLSGLNSGLSSVMGLYADELTYYGTANQGKPFYDHTVVPGNTYISGFWSNAYSQIYAANAILHGVEGSAAIIGEDRDRLIGEVLFIRAYLHFYLLNLYGDIPYITVTDYNINSVIPKLSQQEIQQRIITDLTNSANLLPDTYPTDERVRPNKAVVYALFARVYLYMEDWEKAETYASTVINNPDYVWEDNLGNVFLKDSPAIIWSLHPGAAGLNTKDARTFIFSAGPPTRPALSSNLMNDFEPGDMRKTSWTKTITNGSNSWFCAFKYKKAVNTTPSQEYTILFRLEEQYMIRAEARAHLANISGAQNDLNKIRNRAGLSDTSADFEQTLIDAIIRERRVEFFTEQGHRWFDLKRTGRAASVLTIIKPSWQDTDVLLPLPESELLLNENLLPQNPGY